MATELHDQLLTKIKQEWESPNWNDRDILNIGLDIPEKALPKFMDFFWKTDIYQERVKKTGGIISWTPLPDKSHYVGVVIAYRGQIKLLTYGRGFVSKIKDLISLADELLTTYDELVYKVENPSSWQGLNSEEKDLVVSAVECRINQLKGALKRAGHQSERAEELKVAISTMEQIYDILRADVF